MRQLAQRITGRYHLEPLTRDETATYVDHRLKVAGAVGRIFDEGAKRELYRATGGVPRMINVIADRALLGAYTGETHQVSAALVRQAVREVGADGPATRPRTPRLALVALLGIATLAVTAAAGLAGVRWYRSRLPAAVVPVADVLPAAPTPAPADVESLPALLAATGEGTSTDAAFDTLFGLWQAHYTPGAKRGCLQAEEQGLQCLYQRGPLAQVRELGRPVIVTVRDAADEPRQLVLSGLGDTIATVRIGEAEHRIATAELERHWFGEYLLLWRPSAAGTQAFFPGMRDPGVRWLRESLAAIEGQPVEPMDSDLYDDRLAARIRDYQQARHLAVDGLAGQATLLAIHADLDAGDDDTPRLAWSE